MLSYLEKFNQLPADVKAGVSSPEVISAINELEKKYNISLASVIMRVMIKDIPILDLAKFFVFEHSLEKKQAEELVDELKETVFFKVSDYLGIEKEAVPQADDVEFRSEEKAPDIQRSSFFFSSEDEEEVRNLAKSMRERNIKPLSGAQPAVNFEQVIDKTIMESGVSFGSEELKTRFRQIAATYLKGIRGKIDAKSAFTKDALSGGVGMKDIFADNILLLLDKNKSEAPKQAPALAEDAPIRRSDADEGVKQSGFEIGLGASRDVAYDFNAIRKASPDNRKQEDGRPERQAEAGRKKLAFNLEDVKKAEAAKAEAKAGEKKPEQPRLEAVPAPRPPEARPSAKIKRHTAEGQGKVKMQDVKFVPKLTGPIDELREMDIVNFRRLSGNPSEAAGKIKEKLEFLEGESYSQRLKGIEAWRLSPVNRMYLSAGNESMENNIPVGQVLSQNRGEDPSALSLEEFNAIMELNKQLRF